MKNCAALFGPQEVITHGQVKKLAAVIRKRNPALESLDVETELRVFLNELFLFTKQEAEYLQKITGRTHIPRWLEDMTGILIISPDFPAYESVRKTIEVPLLGYSEILRSTPQGDDYYEKVPRPFQDFSQMKWRFQEVLVDNHERLQNKKNVASGFGFTSGSGFTSVSAVPDGHHILRVRDSFIRREIRSPKDVVRFFKGFRAPTLEEAVQIVSKGLTSSSLKDLEGEIMGFLGLSLNMREHFISTEILRRKNLDSPAVIGGSLEFEFARRWGNFVVLEFSIPREAMRYNDSKSLYAFEGEVFVPFFIHPEWATRILDSKTGQTLYEFRR